MGAVTWLSEHWFDVIQTVGVVGGLLLTAYTINKDAKAHQMRNLIAINARHDRIWSMFYHRPELSRVLQPKIDLVREPISDHEWLFVRMLFTHLDTVRRTSKAGMFVTIEGMKKDVKTFMELPIPRAVWEKLKPFQDADFVAFIDG